MGKIKYIQEVREFFKKSPVVSISSLKKFIKKKDKRYVHLLINNLIKKQEIKKITKGFYTTHEDPSLLVFCFKPAYLGLQDALSIHNLWEQETVPVIITVKKIRRGARKVFGNNVLLRKLDKKYFFGIEYIKQGDFYFPCSDIEKTFIDMLYFRQNLDKETLKEIKQRINKKKLEKYLRNYPGRFRKKADSFGAQKSLKIDNSTNRYGTKDKKIC